MKWVGPDLERYVQAKEYIDTIVMPLIPFNLSDDKDALKKANQNEILTIIINEIESELSGRVMLIPNYYYLSTASKNSEVERINDLNINLSTQPFEHSFFITFDTEWKQHEKNLDGNLLWMPGLQSGDIHSKEVALLIRDYVSQICELIRSYW